MPNITQITDGGTKTQIVDGLTPVSLALNNYVTLLLPGLLGRKNIPCKPSTYMFAFQNGVIIYPRGYRVVVVFFKGVGVWVGITVVCLGANRNLDVPI